MIRQRRLVQLAIAVAVLFSAGCIQELRSPTLGHIGVPVDVNDTDMVLSVLYDPQDVPHALIVQDGARGTERRISGPGGIGFLAYAFNDDGVVVGETVEGEGYQQVHRAVRWSADDGFTTIPLPDGTFQSWAADVNNNGVIVFNAYSPAGSPADGAYLWTPGAAAPTRLPDPPGAANGRSSVAQAINDAGVVVGSSGYGAPEGGERAIRWAAGTRAPTVLPAPGVSSRALDVNEQGTAVGATVLVAGEQEHAAVWSADGVFDDLGVGIAEAVNDRGFVVGQKGRPGQTPVANVWSTVTHASFELGELRMGEGSNATALNNRGRAVGTSDNQSVHYSLPTP